MNKGNLQEKQTIYWDIDDVILNTSETVIKIINEKYRKPKGLKEKTLEDLKDWGFKSIYSKLTKAQLNEIFESDEFWESVIIKDGFKKILEDGILDQYNNIMLTKGTRINIIKKISYLIGNLQEDMKKFEYIALKEKAKKSDINMTGGIQIDDNYENLKDSNAAIKILVKNGIETNVNNSYGEIDTPNNLYNVNSLKEVLDIIRFNMLQSL